MIHRDRNQVGSGEYKFWNEIKNLLEGENQMNHLFFYSIDVSMCLTKPN